MKPYYEDTASGIVIYHGDCLAVLPGLTGIDAVVTDPPYGLGDSLNKGGGSWGVKYRGATEWDSEARQEWIDAILSLSVPSIVWGGNHYQVPPSRGWLSFSKTNAVPTMASVELAWTNLDMPAKEYRATNYVEDRCHPTQKRLDLIEWCLSLVPSTGTILDPFMGSGTTLVAAKRMGRKAIGIEINEAYCEISANRLRQGVLFGVSGGVA